MIAPAIPWGRMSRRTAPALFIRLPDQLRITTMPTAPISGSIHTRPKSRPADSPITARADTAASAMTCDEAPTCEIEDIGGTQIVVGMAVMVVMMIKAVVVPRR